VGSANLDLVRSIFADWARGEYFSGDWADHEIEFVVADGPDPGRWTGPAGMAEHWRDFLSNWQDARAEAEEYRELDDERVLVLFRQIGRGKTSGLEVAHTRARAANLFQIRGGKVTRLVLYFDSERALANLGPAAKGGGAASPE
jgi:ketosteroid isomerase-like protein